MTDSDNMVALVDMDGTVADFDGAMRRDLAKLQSPEEGEVLHHGPDEDEPDWLKARKRLIKTQPGWWRNLKPLPLGINLYRIMVNLGFRTVVLTKGPSTSTNAWTEKVEWCQKHLPKSPVCIVGDKGLVYGRILMDDYPAYIEQWLEWRPRGQVLMPDQPWNEDFEHPQVTRVSDCELDYTKARGVLQAVMNR